MTGVQTCALPILPKGGTTIRRHLKQVPYFDLKQAAKGKDHQVEQPLNKKTGGETITETKTTRTDEQSNSGYLDLQNSTIKEERNKE